MPRRQPTEEFSAELKSHLDLETDRLIGQGLSPEEAHAQARRALGNVGQIQEQRYIKGHVVWLEQLWRDIRWSARSLAAKPLFAATAIVSLGLGLGLNSSLFSMMYRLLYQPAAVPAPDRVVDVYQNQVAGGGRMTNGPWTWVSLPDYVRYRDGTTRQLSLAAYRTDQTLMHGTPPVEVAVSMATCNLFAALEVPMDRGRALVPADCLAAGGQPVAIIAHGFWRNHFGADPAIVGKPLTIRGHTLTVIGVAQAGFAGLGMGGADLWIPVTMQPLIFPDLGPDGLLERENASWLAMVGRLAPGITRVQAQAALAVVGRQTVAYDSTRRVVVEVVRASLFSEPGLRQRSTIWLAGLLATSGLIVLLACTNLINLFLARGLARRREIAIRLSIGASRAMVVRQLMIEALLIAVGGAGLGGALMYWVPPLLAEAATGGMLSKVDFAPNGLAYGYSAAIGLAAALLFGLVPALGATRLNLATSTRDGDARSGTFEARRSRHFLVAFQVAGSALFVATAATCIRSLGHSLRSDLGYRVDGIATVRLSTRELGYDAGRSRAVYDRIQQTLAARPDVKAVALTHRLPFSGFGSSDVFSPSNRKAAWAMFHRVSAEFFATMNIPLLRGRVFSSDELVRGNGPAPIIISAKLAEAFWPGADPIGQQIIEGYADGPRGETFTVVGVVGDIRTASLGETDQESIYRGIPAADAGGTTFVVAASNAEGLVREAPALVREVDPGVLVEAGLLRERLDRAVAPIRLAARFAMGIGGVALALAVIGIFGVVSHGVSQRRREFGVRMALGANRRRILQSATSWGLTAVLVGLGAGAGLVAASTRLLRGLFVGIDGFDLPGFAAMLAIMGVVAGAALVVPAWRATRIDPSHTLRSDG